MGEPKDLNHCYEESDGVVGYAQCLDRGLKREKIMKSFFPKLQSRTLDPKYMKSRSHTQPTTGWIPPGPGSLPPLNLPAQQGWIPPAGRSPHRFNPGHTVRSLKEADKDTFFGEMEPRATSSRYHSLDSFEEPWALSFEGTLQGESETTTKRPRGHAGNGWSRRRQSAAVTISTEQPKEETNLRSALKSISAGAESHAESRRLPQSYLKSLRRLERVWSQRAAAGIHRQKRDTVTVAKMRHFQARRRMQAAFAAARQGRIPGYPNNHGLFPTSPGKMVAEFLTKAVKQIKEGDGAKKLRQKSWRETYGDIKEKIQTRRRLRQQQEKIKRTMKKLVSSVPIELDEVSDSRRPLAANFVDFEYEEEGYKTTELPPLMQVPEIPENRTNGGYFSDPLWPINAMKDLYFIAKALSGGKVHENATFRALSPKFFNLFPEKETEAGGEHDENFLSPSVLSFHDEGLAPLPKLLKQLTGPERNAWIDFVVEASGASDAMEDFDKAFGSDRELAGLPSRLFSQAVTRENATDLFGDIAGSVLDAWQRLYATYSDQQVDQLNTKGFAFFNKEQLNMLYGPKGILNGTKADFDIDAIDRMDDSQKERVLQDYVGKVAKSKGFEARYKDVVLTPIVVGTPIDLIEEPAVSTPITLSPLVLSPIILSPSVLGPITLSPWVLTPLILSPRVLSPFTLTPTVGAPFILSPLVLHSLVLSPGVMDPFILNPFVLAPLILSPEVMNPKILSPFVLSPLILSPGVMNPLVLSPFALSPLILSPQDLFALVLSPRAYSPLIKSKLKRSKIVLSPSIFS